MTSKTEFKDRVLFGILHTKEITLDTPYNVPICLHTEFGNLYITKESKHQHDINSSACFSCAFESYTCKSVSCLVRFLKKYRKNNLKVLEKMNVFNAEYMENRCPDSNWKEFYDYVKNRNIERTETGTTTKY